MAVKSNKNTVINERFRAAFKSYIETSGKKKIEIAGELGINTGTLSNLLKNGASSAMMEEIAGKLGFDLLDMLAEGRSLLAGGGPTRPVAARSPLPPHYPIAPERELELLRQIADMAAKREWLSDELLAKDRLISRLSEANGKLVDILKEAGEEGLIPPDLIFSALMRLAEAGNQER